MSLAELRERLRDNDPLVTSNAQVSLSVAGNERVELDERGVVTGRAGVPVVRPTWS